MSKVYGKTADELKENEYIMDYTKKAIENEMVIEFLTQNAKIK